MAKKTNYAGQYEIVCADELRKLRSLQTGPTIRRPNQPQPNQPSSLLRTCAWLLGLHLAAAVALWLVNRK